MEPGGTWDLVAHPSTSPQEPPTQLATEPAETVLMPTVGVPEALEAEAIEAVEALEAVAEGGRNLGKKDEIYKYDETDGE